MKRFAATVLASAAICSTSQAVAGDGAVGMTLDYEEVMMMGRVSGLDVTDHYDAVGASGVLDLTYVRLTLGYSTNIGNQIRFVDGDELKDGGYRIKYLNATALGKYPCKLGGDLTLWPALGLRGAYNIQYDYKGSQSRVVNDAPHDLLIVGGAGVDWHVAESIALTSALLGTYDLTPGMGGGNSDVTQFSLGLSLGAMWVW